MLLTISTNHQPATDLGFLLHKNPDRVHAQVLSFGNVQMFYPEAGAARCTFALALDVDPVSLVRGRGNQKSGPLAQYVNDRPYVASSFLSVAIARALRNALGGTSKERPELAETAIELEALVTPLPVRGSEELLSELFEPLGYAVDVRPIALDEEWPDWGASPYVELRLKGRCRLSALLSHLYVLIPVLDRQKHYYIDNHELEKLLDKGEGWLTQHPMKTFIVARYLDRRKSMVAEALERLADDVGEEELEGDEASGASVEAEGGEKRDDEARERLADVAEEALEKPIRLHDLRLDRVAEVLREARVRRVIDLGCGSGKLLKRLLEVKSIDHILGVEVSAISLQQAGRRLKYDRMSERQRARITLVQGALTYRDARLDGYDAAALVEVIEHLDLDRLAALERVVFECAAPAMVVVTTPNREYNALFEGMAPGALRHSDHRFEWTRAEFEGWARPVAERFGYGVRFEGLGEEDAQYGAPSQMAIFQRGAA